MPQVLPPEDQREPMGRGESCLGRLSLYTTHAPDPAARARRPVAGTLRENLSSHWHGTHQARLTYTDLFGDPNGRDRLDGVHRGRKCFDSRGALLKGKENWKIWQTLTRDSWLPLLGLTESKTPSLQLSLKQGRPCKSLDLDHPHGPNFSTSTPQPRTPGDGRRKRFESPDHWLPVTSFSARTLETSGTTESTKILPSRCV